VQLDDLTGMVGVPDLRARLDAVESALVSALRRDDAVLGKASERVATAGGKRLRPILTIAAADHGGAYDARVVAGAAAVELVQVGSLVHDDIFEEAATRRGVPTINAVEGGAHAILAGDYILARAGQLAAEVSPEAAGLLARTVVGLCVGQMVEMRDLGNLDRTVEGYRRSIRGKTAVLFAASCQIGSMCADADEATQDRWARYGEAFGMAFQLLDDVLDLVAVPEKLGKPVGIDLETGVYTLPVLEALGGERGGELRGLIERGGSEALARARGLVEESGTIEAVLDEARHWAEVARESLGESNGDARLERLAELPAHYLEAALAHFTTAA
jgi:heptaprenyl diphosphate synthase